MKKLIALLCVAALLLCALGGCGSAAEEAAASAPQESAASEAPAEEAPAAPEAAAEPAEEAPAAEEGSAAEPAEEAPEEDSVCELAKEVFGEEVSPAEWSLPLADGEALTMAVTFAADKLQNYCPNGTEDFVIFQEAEKITGVDLQITSLSTSASASQFPIMIASGDYPDMIGWGLNYNGGNELAVEEGVYLDLVDIIKDYAPNYYALLAADEELLNSALTENGYITNFCTLSTTDSLGTFGPVIRTDLLEKVGLDKPYTIDEYTEALTAFKNMGIAEPLTMMSTGCPPQNLLCEAYGVSGYQATFPMTVAPIYVADGEIRYGFVEDEYLDYMELVQGWLADGLISKEFISENANWNGSSYASKIIAGQVGVFYADKGNIAGYNSASDVEGFRVEATYDAHLTKDSINHFASISKKSAGNGVCITDKCENVELAAQWCDWWYTEEGSFLANYGVEGTSYEMIDGKPSFTDTVRNFELGTRDALMIYASNNTICCVIDPGAIDSLYEEVDVAAPAIWAEGCDDAYIISNDVSLNTEEQETYTTKYADIATYCEENITKFIVGDKPMDEWDAFIEGLWTLGLQDCLDVYQSAYDRYAANLS